MHAYRLSRLVKPEGSRLRFLLAGVCAILGVVLIGIAIRFEKKDFLSSSQAVRHPGDPYASLWFDPAGALVGARMEPSRAGGKLTLERWFSGDVAVREADLPGLDALHGSGSAAPQWRAAPDLSLVVWIAGNTLDWEALPSPGEASGASPIAVPLPRDRNVLALGILPDRSVAAVLSDGSVERWESSSGTVIERWRSRLTAADQAVVAGDYLALSSAQAGRLLLYRFRTSPHDPNGWTLQEEAVAPDPPYTLVVPAPGVMAQLTPAGLRLDGQTRSGPGELRFAASNLHDVIATGDFEGVVVLPPEGDAYELAPAAPGSLAAVDRTHVAVSGPRGTILFKLTAESRLTNVGREVSFAGVAFLALAGIFPLAPFWGNLLSKLNVAIVQSTAARIEVSARLPDPPADLVKTLAAGEGVLWAGAGLSAQSGFPLRQTFVLTLLQLATMESWSDAPLLRKLTELSFRDPEAALNQLTASIGRLRHHMVPYYRATFVRFACLSRAHGYLASLPLAGAITTNYDRLLQQVGKDWDGNVITLRPARGSEARASETQTGEKTPAAPFLLKLYGDPEANDTMMFSRDEFHAAVAQSPVAGLLRQVFETNTVMFVGCSLDGLLADLNELGLPAEPRRKHFALAAVSDSVWEKQAAELTRRFGIEVLVCSADQIHAALPEFLGNLAEQIDQIRAAPRGDAAKTSAARQTLVARQTSAARRAS